MREIDIRLKRLRPIKKKCDNVLIFGNDPNFRYYTNSDAKEVFLYDFSDPVIISSEMGEIQSRNSWIKKINICRLINSNKKLIDCVVEKTNGVVGVNKDAISAGLFSKLEKKIEIVDISNDLSMIRSLKTDYEIRYIKKSCKINGKIFNEIENYINAGVSEFIITGMIEKIARDYNAFPMVMVAFGKHTGSPHHEPTNKKLKDNEPVLIDLVCSYNGYYSDVTRTFGSNLKYILDPVFDEVVNMIKPGIPAKDLDIAAREKLGNFSRFFITSLGHGIGVAVHEKPWIYKKSMDILMPGMVFAIEPGIYMKNGGIRKESDFLMTRKGCINLTDF